MRGGAFGWDMRHFNEGTGITGSGVSIETTTVHNSGNGSLKILAASGTAGAHNTGLSNIYGRIYFLVTALPSTARVFAGQINTGQLNLRLNPSGTIGYYVNTSLIGTSTAALTDTTKWYRIEWAAIAGTSVVLLRIEGNDEITGTNATAPSPLFQFGANDTVASTYTAFVDDYVVDSAEWVGDSKLALALPISDNARAAKWVAGSNATTATTNLFAGVDNTPPAGTATSNAVNAAISHTGGGAGNEDYDANLTTYTTLGVGTLAPRFGTFTQSAGTFSSIGSNSTNWLAATSFAAPASGAIRTLDFHFFKTGSPTDNIIVELWSDDGGSGSAARPLAKLADLVTIPASAIVSNARNSFVVPVAPSLTSGTRYWIYMYRSGGADASNFVQWYADNTARTGDTAVTGTSAAVYSLVAGTKTLDFIYGTGDEITCLMPLAVHGEDIATGTKTLAYGVKSNPNLGFSAAFAAGNDGGAVGAYPTNWIREKSLAVATRPAISALGTSPVMTARRTSTDSRSADVCFMGMYVEWKTYAATGGNTQSGGLAIAGAAAFSPTGSASLTAGAAYAGAGAFTPDGVRVASGGAAYAGAASFTGDGQRGANGGAAFAGSGAFTASAVKILEAALAIAGAATASFTGSAPVAGGLAIAGSAAAGFTGQLSAAGAAAYLASGAFGASAQQILQAAISLAASGAVSFTPGVIRVGGVSYTGAAAVALAAVAIANAGAAYAGSAAATFGGGAIRDAGAAYLGSATLSVLAQLIAQGAWGAAGSGIFTVDGVATSGSGSGVSFAGAAAVAFAAQVIRAGGAQYAGSGLTTMQASAIMTGGMGALGAAAVILDAQTIRQGSADYIAGAIVGASGQRVASGGVGVLGSAQFLVDGIIAHGGTIASGGLELTGRATFTVSADVIYGMTGRYIVVPALSMDVDVESALSLDVAVGTAIVLDFDISTN